MTETIAALATPPGRGGIGVIRISGPAVQAIAMTVLGEVPKVRFAQYHSFKSEDEILDQGLALFFKAPHSFTGEDVLELQGHGSPVVMDRLLKHVINLGARMARPGEFSERAFLNDKIDLVQAEAIADLIDSSSEQAARAAMRSLQGDFSREIDTLKQALIRLRVYVEAALDFPDEDIDFLTQGHVFEQIKELLERLNTIKTHAQQGVLLHEGIHLVIVGPPNAGKSSLMNRLSGRDSAIVTDIPGTTRDVLREQLNINGIPIHLSDTAGLRDSIDPVEQEGIRRAHLECERADLILFMIDRPFLTLFNNTEGCTNATTRIGTAFSIIEQCQKWYNEFNQIIPKFNKKIPIIFIRNKIDLTNELPLKRTENKISLVHLSAKTGAGLDELKTAIVEAIGTTSNVEGAWGARSRHLIKLSHTEACLRNALEEGAKAPELLAEDLKCAHQHLCEITGEWGVDELLGEIFSSFCIGK